MAEIIKIFLLSLTPVGELRASIPAGLVVYGLDWHITFLISIIGNVIPAILILAFLKPISEFLSSRFKVFNKFFSFLFSKTRDKHGKRIKKWGSIALISFVAIPLPITGAWTGSLVAFLFNIPFGIAFPLIALGVIVAGFVVTYLTKAGIVLEAFLGWQTLLGLIILIILIYYFLKNHE